MEFTDNLFEGISSLQDFTQRWLRQQGWSEDWITVVAILMNTIILLVLCWVFYQVVKLVLKAIVKAWANSTHNHYIEVFIEKKAFSAVAYLITGFFIYYLVPFFYNMSAELVQIVHILIGIYIIVMILKVITRSLRSVEVIAQRDEKYEHKPIRSYIQTILIIAYLICGILIISTLIGQNPMTIITAFGAGMAIFLLIFKDIILGLVASITLSVNDMVRLGDWISVQNYNADGDLIEINLMSVKIRNWDKTVTNVPTYVLVSNGFINWREMQDLGIRRLKQNILLDVLTIKEVDGDFIQHLRDKNLFEGDINDVKWTDGNDYSYEKVTTITNLGLLRRYIEQYLNRHPGVSDVYVVIHHLQQNENGLPLGIYAFCNDVSWKPLQSLQADIFEHIYSVLEEFELLLYQRHGGEGVIRINTLENDEDKESEVL